MVIIKNHPVKALNDSSAKAGLGGVVGVNRVKRFGDIDVEVYYKILDNRNGSQAKSMVYSSVSMQSISIAFMGFASIGGTADAEHTKKFAGSKKDAVRTDIGVLDKTKHNDNYTVKTSLVSEEGYAISLDKSRFTSYKEWHD